ncbi:MAG: hypothetical protein HKN47_01830 [Pirellulaceae bacterium]|nr:hypothetical protein [Pirellulaceae bacterium]
MTRILNTLLILVIVIGMVTWVRQRQSIGHQEREYQRLAANYGVLDVQDSKKFLVTRIDTDDPMHFLWRVYYPAKISILERESFADSGKSGGSFTNIAAREQLFRIRIEFTDTAIRAHILDGSGGSLLSYNRAQSTDFLKAHWQDLEFDVLAADGTRKFDTDEVLPFLRVRLPDDLIEELDRSVSTKIAESLKREPIFESLRGTPEAFEQWDRLARENAL